MKPVILSICVAGIFTACAPTIKLAAPDKPIEINMKIEIDQEVRVRLDEDVEDLLKNNPDIF